MINADTVLAQRTQRGLSQRQLAKHVGVSYATISRMENGSDTSDLPLSVLGRLAAALELEPGALLCATQSTIGMSSDTPTQHPDEAPLHHSAACLLRKIHRGDDIRKTMSRSDRELTLPTLAKSGFVIVEPCGVRIAESLANALSGSF